MQTEYERHEARQQYAIRRNRIFQVAAFAAALIAAIALSRCAVTTRMPSSVPICRPCLQPASGPVVLDEVGVRELLAGVALEEGAIASDRDMQHKRADIAESYAEQVKRTAVIAGVGSTFAAVVLTALITWAATIAAQVRNTQTTNGAAQ